MGEMQVIATGDRIEGVLENQDEALEATFEGIGIEEGQVVPVLLFRCGGDLYEYALDKAAIEAIKRDG